VANIFRVTAVILLLGVLLSFLDRFPAVQPVQLNAASVRKGPVPGGAVDSMRKKIEALGASKEESLKISDAILTASEITGVDADFIAALMYTESSFDMHAVSSAPPTGYYGLMQVPFKVFDAHANTIIGANIYSEKLKLAGHDPVMAVVLYKGHGWNRSGRALAQADSVIRLCNKIKRGG